MTLVHEICILCVFALSGLIHPLVLFWLSECGAADPSTLLYILPSYIGMTLSGVFLYKIQIYLNDNDLTPEIVGVIDSNDNKVPHTLLAVLAFCDLASSCLHMIGLIYAGSSIFTLAYSSITITTAIFSRIILKRHLHILQWFGLVVIACGLAWSGVFKLLPHSFSMPTDPAGTTEQMPELGHESLGVAMIVAASLVHAFCFVLTEKLLTDTDADVRVSPHMLCISMGLSGIVLYGLWQFFFTIPRWETLVTQQIHIHEGNTSLIAFAYLFLCLNSIVHTLCFFRFIIKLGCISVSVLKGVQSTLLFVFSHWIYCSPKHLSQCWNAVKAESMAVTLLGVLIYGNFRLANESLGTLTFEGEAGEYLVLDETEHIVHLRELQELRGAKNSEGGRRSSSGRERDRDRDGDSSASSPYSLLRKSNFDYGAITSGDMCLSLSDSSMLNHPHPGGAYGQNHIDRKKGGGRVRDRDRDIGRGKESNVASVELLELEVEREQKRRKARSEDEEEEERKGEEKANRKFIDL